MSTRRTSRTVRIKSVYAVVPHDRNTVELRSGVWNPQSITLVDHSGAGRLSTLVSGLDGTRDRAELAKEAGVTRTELEALIDHLDQLAVLEHGPSTALDAYLDRTASGRVEEATLPSLRVLGGTAAAQVAGLLGAHEQLTVTAPDAHAEQLRLLDECPLDVLEDGLAFERFVENFEDWRGCLLVHVADAVHPLRLAVLNRVALALGTPWIQAALDGPLLLVGPTFVPDSTACFTCFETRVVMNLREGAAYQRYKKALAGPGAAAGEQGDGGTGVLSSLLASHTALEALNMAVTGMTSTVGKVLGVYLPSMEMVYSEVLRLPGCPSCGTVPERDGTEVYFDVRRWVDA
ncbi:TOMM precursor leader peptide-binding protein [Streptomyces formicae]|uniref:Streptolysin S biosynthesis protein C (SagC) n=1 Tax=Streptomyces formicae TaxID=1616117 RepID=A0A291Q9U6_9ACTN|nr:TOMM precursor leader peptide-binding protein [Streptomyces formicae]ATL28267.1 Streptolysin S biosynthesis protein C (SagC) [Streptomyces formicae]